jgi:glycosyl transferase family 25
MCSRAVNKTVAYYCINLAKDKDRRSRMTERANNFSFEMIFVDAVNGENIDPNKISIYKPSRFNRKLTKYEIACSLSHIRTLEIFLESDYDYAVVFEDDAIIVEDIKKISEEYALKNNFFDILKLDAKKYGSFNVGEVLNCKLMLGHKYSHGAFCLMYSRKGAQKALRLNKVICMPYDTNFLNAWRQDLKFAILKPSAVKHEDGISSIGERASKFLWVNNSIFLSIPIYFFKIEKSFIRRLYMVLNYFRIKYYQIFTQDPNFNHFLLRGKKSGSLK